MPMKKGGDEEEEDDGVRVVMAESKTRTKFFVAAMGAKHLEAVLVSKDDVLKEHFKTRFAFVARYLTDKTPFLFKVDVVDGSDGQKDSALVLCCTRKEAVPGAAGLFKLRLEGGILYSASSDPDVLVDGVTPYAVLSAAGLCISRILGIMAGPVKDDTRSRELPSAAVVTEDGSVMPGILLTGHAMNAIPRGDSVVELLSGVLMFPTQELIRKLLAADDDDIGLRAALQYGGQAETAFETRDLSRMLSPVKAPLDEYLLMRPALFETLTDTQRRALEDTPEGGGVLVKSVREFALRRSAVFCGSAPAPRLPPQKGGCSVM